MKKRNKIIWLVVLFILILATIGYFLLPKSENLVYSSIIVEKGPLTQTVSEVGAIKSIKGVDLNFNKSGKLSRILVKTGDEVRADQVLAELDSSSLAISQTEARSSMSIASANLNKLLSGASASEVAVVEARVNQAESAYLSAIKNLETLQKSNKENISQAEIKLYDLNDVSNSTVTSFEQALKTAELNVTNTKSTYQQTINNYRDQALNIINYQLSLSGLALDSVLSILDDKTAEPYLSAQNSSYLINTKSLYKTSRELLTSVEEDYQVARFTLSQSSLSTSLASSLSLLNMIFSTLNSTYNILDNSVTSSNFSQQALDNYISMIINQRNTINSGISSVENSLQNLNSAYLSYQTNVSSAENSLAQARVNLSEAISSAGNNLSLVKLNSEKSETSAISQVESSQEAWLVAKSELKRLQSPARSEDVQLARAQLSQAQSSLDLISKQIEDNIIKAPISGQVSEVNYEVGEQVSPNKAVFNLLTANDFEIEVDISEADINKIKVTNKVEISFDAFSSDEKFSGAVASISPAETVISEVIYYQVKIQLLDSNSPYFKQIKPGMTANADIVTAELSDVIAIPSRSIIDRNGEGKFVKIMENGEVKELRVETGLRGDDGLIEVKTGLEADIELITYIESQ